VNKIISLLLSISLSLALLSCNSNKKSNSSEINNQEKKNDFNLLYDVNPIQVSGEVNAVIEIPAGTIEKWEYNKSTGKLQREIIDNKKRTVNYLGYPGNYGMIPRTLLSKEKGGDGDPLDIIVLGPPAKRGQILKCKIIGVLYLLDGGEQDDKLIAVSNNSPFHSINSIDNLNNDFKGITQIIELWFTNYKGYGKIESKGFGNKKVALDILSKAIEEFKLIHTKLRKE